MSVTASDAILFPTFFANGDRPAITVHAPAWPPTWSISDPKMSGSKMMSNFPASPLLGLFARAAIFPALWPAFSGSNWLSFVAHATPCPLDSRDTRARIDRYRFARWSYAFTPFDVRR